MEKSKGLQKTPKAKIETFEKTTSLPDLKLKYQKLLSDNEKLDKQIAVYLAKGVTTDLRSQMKALHDYNEMKDLTQVVLGYLANTESVSLIELHERYNLPTE